MINIKESNRPKFTPEEIDYLRKAGFTIYNADKGGEEKHVLESVFGKITILYRLFGLSSGHMGWNYNFQFDVLAGANVEYYDDNRVSVKLNQTVRMVLPRFLNKMKNDNVSITYLNGPEFYRKKRWDLIYIDGLSRSFNYDDVVGVVTDFYTLTEFLLEGVGGHDPSIKGIDKVMKPLPKKTKTKRPTAYSRKLRR